MTLLNASLFEQVDSTFSALLWNIKGLWLNAAQLKLQKGAQSVKSKTKVRKRMRLALHLKNSLHQFDCQCTGRSVERHASVKLAAQLYFWPVNAIKSGGVSFDKISAYNKWGVWPDITSDSSSCFNQGINQQNASHQIKKNKHLKIYFVYWLAVLFV